MYLTEKRGHPNPIIVSPVAFIKVQLSRLPSIFSRCFVVDRINIATGHRDSYSSRSYTLMAATNLLPVLGLTE